MSWRDNDQPAGERDWAAAVIAAADEPFDPAGSDAESPDAQPDPTESKAAGPDAAGAGDTADPKNAAAAEAPSAPEAPVFPAPAQSAPDALELDPEPEFIDASAEPAWWSAATPADEPGYGPGPASDQYPSGSAGPSQQPAQSQQPPQPGQSGQPGQPDQWGQPEPGAGRPDREPAHMADSAFYQAGASVPAGPALPALQLAVRQLIATVHDLSAEVRILRAKVEVTSSLQDRARDDVARELSLTREEIIESTRKVDELTRSAFGNAERRTQELLTAHEANVERRTHELFAQHSADVEARTHEMFSNQSAETASVRDVERVLNAIDDATRNNEAYAEKMAAAIASSSQATGDLVDDIADAVEEVVRGTAGALEKNLETVGGNVERVMSSSMETAHAQAAGIERIISAVDASVRTSGVNSEKLLTAVHEAGLATDRTVERALQSAVETIEEAVEALKSRETVDAARRADVESIMAALLEFRRLLTGS
jgi:hypothetical protein